MAKLSSTFHYQDADVESIFALIRDPAFRAESCEAQGADEHEVKVDDDGETATVTIKRLQEAAVPDFVKKFLGEKARVTQTERWGAPGPDGSRTAKVTVDVVGQPAGMKGTATLVNDGTNVAFTVEGDVKVAVPFLGKKIEPPFADAIVESLEHDVKLGQSRL